MFKQPILIYSEYCQHSKNFIQTIMKHPILFDSIIRINIDVDPNTKKRPVVFSEIQKALNTPIKRVPTIITVNAEHILSDVNCFKWLEYKIKTLEKKELQAFSHHEMGSFSDNYADFGGGNSSTHINDAKEQNYKFFDNGVLASDNFLNKEWKNSDNNSFQKGFLDDENSNDKSRISEEYITKQSERERMDQSLNIPKTGNLGRMEIPRTTENKVSEADYMKEFSTRQNTQNTQNHQRPKTEIDFTSDNFGLSGELSNVNRNGSENISVSDKEKLLNDRLEILMNERR